MILTDRISQPLRMILILIVAASFYASIHGQSSSTPGKIQVLKARYEDQCGNPLYESMAWSMVIGRVIKVLDGNTITIVLDNKTRKRVHLAATTAPDLKQDTGKAAHKMLTKLVLGKRVWVMVNPSNAKAGEFTGVIDGVNEKMIELGLVHYKQPAPYTMSNYTACVYRIIETEAQKAKRGLWQQTETPKPAERKP